MAYVDIGAKSPGDYVESTYLNQVRANFQAGVPDIYTTKGDLAVATGADAAARLAVGADDATLTADASTASGLAWQIQPAARVYRSTALDVSAATWTATTFNAERFDTDGMWVVGSPTRLTVPTGGGGLYLIGANVAFLTGITANAASVVGVRIVLNGATTIALDLRNHYRAVAVDLTISLSTLYALSATDYVEVGVYTSQDVDIASGGNYSPEFWAIWQRRA